MMVRRTLEGAEKCALRDFLLEEWRPANNQYRAFGPGPDVSYWC